MYGTMKKIAIAQHKGKIMSSMSALTTLLRLHQITCGTFKADDGTTLYWEMITPKLVPGKRYPVFFQHYGGPGTGLPVGLGRACLLRRKLHRAGRQL